MCITVRSLLCTFIRLVCGFGSCSVFQGGDRREFSVLKRIYRLCRAFSVLSLDMFLSALWYEPPVSVIIYECTHPHRPYSANLLFNLQHHMARCPVRFESPSACEATVVHEVQIEGAVQQQSIESTLSATEPESVWSDRLSISSG